MPMKKATTANPFALAHDARFEFSFLMSDVTRLLRLAFDREMEALGLTRSQWRTLIYVLRLDNPSQTDLAQALDIGRAAAGAQIDQLTESGYVARHPDPADRRIWRIMPTDLAISRVEEISRCADAVTARAFDGLDGQALAAATKLVTRIRENLQG